MPLAPRWTSDRRSGRGERGSVLMLMPVGVLIMVVLGAFMVDFARAHLAARELSNLAAAAANDAAILGIDEEAFQREGRICLLEERVGDAVNDSWDMRRPDYFDVDDPTYEIVTVDGTVPAVRVRGTGRIDTIFAAGLPGGFSAHDVSGASTSVIEQEELGIEGFDGVEMSATC